MAKESMKAREVKRRKLVDKYAEKRKALKEAGDYEALQKLPRNASPVRLHNRCKLTGRPKGYMRQFGISRVTFREMANQGLIPGISYDAYIQTDCGGNNNISDFVGHVTFTTTALGVNDIDVTTFVFAPNPADGDVSIVSTTEITTLQIVNMLGQNVLSMTPNSKEFTIDVSGLSSGAYFINAITNGVTTTKKLIRK